MINIYHITTLNNLASIVSSGELRCYRDLMASCVGYDSIANVDIQDRRDRTLVPCGPGGDLHDYVPFHFAPRSPMLYVISRQQIPQPDIVYLVSTAEAIQGANLGFVFTDGHAIMQLSQFYESLSDIHKIDWTVMNSRYWHDTNDDGDRKRRRQAEFLVHKSVPWSLIEKIAVRTSGCRTFVENLLHSQLETIHLEVQPDWYY